MEISIGEQGYALLQAFLLGGMVGVLYDLLRIVRTRIAGFLMGMVLDFLFWVLVTVALFVHAMVAQGGVVRLYMVLTIFLGATFYFMIFSGIFLKIGYPIADVIGKIWNILVAPVRLGMECGKKFIKFAKKLFHSGLKWFKIKVRHHSRGAVCPNLDVHQEGGHTIEVETDILYDQNCNTSPPSG